MKHGDADERGNPILKHVRCLFCRDYHFSAETLQDHLKKSHFKCQICPIAQSRFIFYKNFDQMQKHFQNSHFVCDELACRSKQYIVFATQKELDKHKYQVHKLNKKKRQYFIEVQPQKAILDGIDFNDILDPDRIYKKDKP